MQSPISPVNDVDRPLEQRGVKDAHLVSSNVHDFLPKTFVVYSSTAKRASATAVIFASKHSISNQ
jgi:phosphohistidine phosphatase